MFNFKEYEEVKSIKEGRKMQLKGPNPPLFSENSVNSPALQTSDIK
jgi:hypothetical protein